MGPPELHTPRLHLRPLLLRDADAVYAYARDAEVARHTLWDAHTSIEDSRTFLALIASRYESGVALDWGIEADGVLVGTIGFFDRREDHRRAEVGYALARSWWGRGVMVEALRAVLGYGFDRLGLHRIVASARVENGASRRVLEKVGFRLEGTARQHLSVKGHWWDVALFGLLVTEWEDGCGS